MRSRDRGGHRGVQVGRVEQADELQGRVVVRLSQPVAAGDVLTIFTPWGQTEPLRVPSEALGGGPQAAAPAAGRLVLRVRERVAVKDRVFRLSAASVDAFAEDAVAGRVVARPQVLSAELVAVAGEAARLRLRAGELEVEVRGEEPLAVAERARLNAGRARDAVGALGGTPYRLAEFHCRLEGDPFLPVGALKELRRRALAELDARRLAACGDRRHAPPRPDELVTAALVRSRRSSCAAARGAAPSAGRGASGRARRHGRCAGRRHQPTIRPLSRRRSAAWPSPG